MSDETNKEDQIKEIPREDFVNSLSLYNLKSSFKSVFEKKEIQKIKEHQDNFEDLISNIEDANTESADNLKE